MPWKTLYDTQQTAIINGQKRWKILPADPIKVNALQKSLNIHPAICKILVQRNIETFEESKAFFRPSLSMLHSPWLMKDMEKATGRIFSAINNNEHIMVYGDYDVDGTTSVASFYQFLKGIYSNVTFYIPHRYREGYGVSRAGIDHAHENNISLIISLDCGIKSVELVSYAKQLNIDFIICDHHLPDKELPDAIAILNAKQIDCSYPYKELCGCGVGFKLMQALAEKFGLSDESYLKYLDLVATAIGADIVPITGENRILVYFGLEKVNKNPCTGIKALLELAGFKKQVCVNDLVFIVAPRINAAGRMDDARKAVNLFIEQDEKDALALAELLHIDNTDRKETDSLITEEALALITGSLEHTNKKTTVVYQQHWHKGVVGIVASRLIENHHRPTVVLTKSGDYVSGSARSVPGFNLYEAIHACRECLINYGGHFAAAGLTMEEKNVEIFSGMFDAYVSANIPPELLIPEIVIDAEINFDAIKINFYNIINQMEPFGPENMRPMFISRNVINTGFSKIVKDNHIRFVLRQGNSTITGIGFNLAKKFDQLNMGKPIDVVYNIDINEWNGELSLQLKVCDFRLSENQLRS